MRTRRNEPSVQLPSRRRPPQTWSSASGKRKSNDRRSLKSTRRSRMPRLSRRWKSAPKCKKRSNNRSCKLRRISAERLRRTSGFGRSAAIEASKKWSTERAKYSLGLLCGQTASLPMILSGNLQWPRCHQICQSSHHCVRSRVERALMTSSSCGTHRSTMR